MPSDDRATAFVLAAGHGSRLRPLTAHVPKPLVPVCGVPMLAYALAALRKAGHRRAVVNAWHLADQVLRWQGHHDGVDVEVVVEPGGEPLGTGGGLKNARDRLASRVTVVNADVLCDADLAALANAVPEGGAALLLRRHAPDAARYGVVSVDDEGAVVRLRDRTADPVGASSADTHFTGLHALDTAVLERLPDGPACIVGDAYLDLVPDRRLRAHVTGRPWLDVGDPAAYLSANLAVLTTTVAVPLDPFVRAGFAQGPRGTHGSRPAGVRIDGPVWIESDAQVRKGAQLSSSVLGARAIVPSGARLTRCVALDDAIVPDGDWADTIFFAGGPLPVAFPPA